MKARSLAWLAVLGIVASPTEAAAQRLPAPASETLRSQVLAEDRTVYVALPESYDRGAARYPVVYLTDADWNFAHTRTSAQLLARNRIIPEVIVVGVTHTDRVRDLYATRADFTHNGRTIPFPTSGKADQFLEFVERELIPWVERSYRTTRLRVFAGHSAGGNFALHAMRTKPGLFQAVIAASPWLAWDEKRELRELLPFVASPNLRVRALFLSHSAEAPDMKPDVDALVAALRQRSDSSVRWVVREYPGETHDTNVLKSFYDGLRTVFAGYVPPRDSAAYGLLGSLEDVRAHFTGWGRRLGVEFEPPVEIVNELGTRYLAADSVDLAMAAFRFNVERHPESAAAWSSLGAGLERSGRRNRPMCTGRNSGSMYGRSVTARGGGAAQIRQPRGVCKWYVTRITQRTKVVQQEAVEKCRTAQDERVGNHSRNAVRERTKRAILDPALGVHAIALAHVLLGELGEAIPESQAMPLCALLVAVFPRDAPARGERDMSDLLPRRGRLDFRVTADVADQGDFVEVASHRFLQGDEIVRSGLVPKRRNGN